MSVDFFQEEEEEFLKTFPLHYKPSDSKYGLWVFWSQDDQQQQQGFQNNDNNNNNNSFSESQPSEVKTRNVAAELSIFDALLLAPPQTKEPLRGMLIEDAGSSHDLTNLCPVTEPLDKGQQLSPKVQPFIPRTYISKTITIEASYREDIIRFHVAANSGIVNLKEEVARRLKLDVGTFDIKYFDDDHEWVLIVCDADFQECVELSISSGCNIVRLLVHDLSTILINYSTVCTYCQNVKYAADVDTRMISDKIKHAFSMVKHYRHGPVSIFQFWAPVTTIGGRRLLSTSGQPFAVSRLFKSISKYRLLCMEYRYNIIHHNNHNHDKQPDIINEQHGDMIISDHALAATAFLNRLPQLVYLDDLEGVSPLVDSALECVFSFSYMLPICFPTQSTSSCIGVVECSTEWTTNKTLIDMKRALEEVGLGVLQAQQRIPRKILDGLIPAWDEIDEVLNIVCGSHGLTAAQVWISFEDDNHLPFSSYLEGTRKKQMLSLKLTGYVADTGSEDSTYLYDIDEYYRLCDTFPLEMGEDFVEKTLQDYKPRFCNDVFKLISGNMRIASLAVKNGDKEPMAFDEVRRLAICLNSIHTGDFCYTFEFIWEDDPDSDDVKFVEKLLLKLKESLPSFKLASGAEFGDELDFIKVGDSTATETKFLKIFQGKRLSPIPEVLEEGTKIPLPMVVDYMAPLEAKYKTTPIPLSREVIEQQFGNTETEAAENLKVSRSTLRRKCRKLGIMKWEGRNKRKVSDMYSNQSDTNEEVTRTIQESLPINRNEHTLTIKAEYAGDMIKFCLHIFQATFQTVMEEIGTRFKLTPGTYKVKYLDEDKDWILLTSEQDISDCIKTTRNSDRTAVRLRVEPSA